jgi:SnoaL-like domain
MSSPSSAQTAQTLQHHLESFYVGDVEAIMTDFAADAVLITPDGTLYGQAQIRPVFETFVTQIMPPGSTLTIVQQIVEGDIAYLLWAGESAYYRIPWGTDTFVIRAGKIVAQTFAAQMEAKDSAAEGG